jgi:hypothetical protein
MITEAEAGCCQAPAADYSGALAEQVAVAVAGSAHWAAVDSQAAARPVAAPAAVQGLAGEQEEHSRQWRRVPRYRPSQRKSSSIRDSARGRAWA